MGGSDLYILSIIAELYGTEFPDFSAHYFNQMIQTVYKNNLLYGYAMQLCLTLDGTYILKKKIQKNQRSALRFTMNISRSSKQNCSKSSPNSREIG